MIDMERLIAGEKRPAALMTVATLPSSYKTECAALAFMPQP
jgi:hypothetical protein